MPRSRGGLAARWQAWELAGRQAALAAPVDPITFPTTPLRLKVEVALGADLTAAPSTWGWQDITSLVYTRDSVTVSRGRPDESTVADTSKLTLTVNNRNGYFSTRNPNSPWYGLLRKGTPIRVFAEGFPRFSGFISALPPRWDLSGNDRYAPLEAQGWLYRLVQGVSPVRSAMKRTILGASNPVPVAYWPCEDAEGSTQIASGLPGGRPLTGVTPHFVESTPEIAGSNGALDLTALSALGLRTVIALPSSSGFQIEFVALSDTAANAVTMSTSGIPLATLATPSDGVVHHLAYQFVQSGSDVAVTSYHDGVFFGSNTVPSVTLTGSLEIYLPLNTPAGVLTELAHLVVYAYANIGSPASRAQGVLGYNGEKAHVRFARLCAEEGVPYTIRAADSLQMGPQGIDSIVPLLRDCEATDQGYMFEGLNFDMVFQGHQERENQVANLVLDYLTSPIDDFQATDDDQQARNDVEVVRDGGSSARLTEESTTAELSVRNIGRRDESVTLSLYDDTQPYHIAGWRLHLETWPGYRYPGMSLNLAAVASRTGDATIDQAARNALITAVCTADLGYRATVDNPPTDIGPDDPSLIVEGYTETLGVYDWTYVANCTLQGPWDVSVLAADTGDTDPHLGWAEFDSCVIADPAGVDTTSTSWTISCSPADAATSDDLPRQHLVDGEFVTVTASTGGTSPTWTVTRSVNGVARSHNAGAAATLVHPFILSL